MDKKGSNIQDSHTGEETKNSIDDKESFLGEESYMLSERGEIN
jgi:hypothetical protein